MDHKSSAAEIECLVCGHRFMHRVWRSGDNTQKNRILNRSIFSTHCPECGSTSSLVIDFVYFDDEHNAVVKLDDKEELIFAKKMVEDEGGVEEGETLYGASSAEDLCTAIMCLDNDFDYRVVKLVLYNLKKEYIKTSGDNKEIEEFGLNDNYNEKGELMITIYYTASEEKVYAPFPMDTYSEYVKLYKGRLDKSDMFVFDDEGCEFFYNHIEDIDNDNKQDITVYLAVTAKDMCVALADHAMRKGDALTLDCDEDRHVGFCADVYHTNTIALGREVDRLPKVEDYIEGGIC